MHYKIFENVIDKKLIDDIFTFYNNSETYTTNGMHKVEQPWTLEVVRNLEPILSNYFDTSLENIGDNIYKHDFPYFPHVDISKAGYPCFNVLIPIKVENDIEQKFCVFDQYVNDFSAGATWVGKLFNAMKEFEHNKKRRFIFKDSIVQNKTGEDIDEDFYVNYLEYRGRDRNMFKSCSGVALDFTPGNLIMFDSKYIHCTGKMNCKWKVGLSLRFKGSFE